MNCQPHRAIAIVVAITALTLAMVQLPGDAENLGPEASTEALVELLGREKAKQTPASPKFLQFPKDHSIGRVHVWLPGLARGQDYCEAIGTVPCLPGYVSVLRPHATQVSKPGYFDQVPTNIEGLDMALFDVDNAQVKRLSTRFKNLRVLSLESADIDDTVFDYLVKLPRLEYLDLRATAIDGSGLTRLNRMPALTQINFTQSTLRPENCIYLVQAPNLADIRVAHCAISDLSCKYFAKMPRLKLLDLDNTLVTDKGVAELIPLKNRLRDLDVSSCKVGEAGFKSLGQITSLNRFRMRTRGCTPLSAKAIQYLGGAKNLNALDIADSAPGNDVVEAIAKYLPAIASLNLSRCKKITDQGVSKLAVSKNLVALYLSGAGTGDGSLDMAKTLPKLIMLQAGNTLIGDRALVRFCAAGGPVKHLVLDNTKITDAGMVSIQKLKKLTSAAFNETKLTDASAKNLSGVKSLTGLGIEHTKFTPVGVKQIKQALPGCFVRY